jgi:putative chitinase
MNLSLELLDKIAGKPVNRLNATSLLAGIAAYPAGLDRAHNAAQFLAQVMHESGSFRWDGEIWGPTAAQDRYDVRADLGNTPERDGDGELYKGRSAIQLTGKGNYVRFQTWCRDKGLNPPNLVANPDLVLTDPWEGLAPIFYWDTRAGLQEYAEDGNFEMVTRLVNGGTNGFEDRLRYLGRASLVLLGREADSIRTFQAELALKADGIIGPKTRAALHKSLKSLVVEPPIADRIAILEARVSLLDARLSTLEAATP